MQVDWHTWKRLLQLATVLTAVVVPEKARAQGSIIEMAAQAGVYTKVLAAIDAAGMTEAFAGGGPVTCFFPSDDAISAWSDAVFESMVAADAKVELEAFINGHVVAQGLSAAQLLLAGSVQTAAGATQVVVAKADGTVEVAGAAIEQTLVCSNGFIHGVARVFADVAAQVDVQTAVTPGSWGGVKARLQ